MTIGICFICKRQERIHSKGMCMSCYNNKRKFFNEKGVFIGSPFSIKKELEKKNKIYCSRCGAKNSLYLKNGMKIKILFCSKCNQRSKYVFKGD